MRIVAEKVQKRTFYHVEECSALVDSAKGAIDPDNLKVYKPGKIGVCNVVSS